jgi:hypothetical protein
VTGFENLTRTAAVGKEPERAMASGYRAQVAGTTLVEVVPFASEDHNSIPARQLLDIAVERPARAEADTKSRSV